MCLSSLFDLTDGTVKMNVITFHVVLISNTACSHPQCLVFISCSLSPDLGVSVSFIVQRVCLSQLVLALYFQRAV